MRRNPEEALARSLCASLERGALEARVEGLGVHWAVLVGAAEGRSARVGCLLDSVTSAAGEYAVALLDAQRRIATGRTRVADEVLSCLRAWLAGESLDALVLRSPFIDCVERDAAGRHWLLVSEWMTRPDDTLAPLRPLLERLLTSPIATRFYTFTSHDELCFSASSHYPWVNRGLPVVAPRGVPSRVTVDGVSMPIEAAFAAIERALAAYPVAPFVGSADDLETNRG